MKLPNGKPKTPIKRSVPALLFLLSFLLIITTIASCGSPTSATASKIGDDTEATEKKLKIIATIFPHYDFTRAIVGERADITMLLPPGVESHSYDPTPADIIAINECDLFIYTGADMEAWAESILEGVSNKDIHVISLADNVSVVDIYGLNDGGIDDIYDLNDDNYTIDNHDDYDDDDHDDHAEDGHAHVHEHDPHIWTNPVIASAIVDSILSVVCELDPENEQYYTENASAYKMELKELNTEFRNIVATSKRKEIYFGDRFALKYFALEYGIEFHAAFDSCSSEAEPSASTITKMIDEIKDKNIPVIYHAELNDPKIARSLSEATGAEMLLFHSCHNVTKEEFDDGITYVDLMRVNAENLRRGLN